MTRQNVTRQIVTRQNVAEPTQIINLDWDMFKYLGLENSNNKPGLGYV